MKIKYQFLTVAAVAAALFLLGAAWVELFGLGAPAAQAYAPQAQGNTPRTITVVGEGQVKSPADVAVVYIGVQVSDPDVKVATEKAATDMESLLTALKAEGVADKDIQTSYYSLYVDRPYNPQGVSGEPVYQLSNNVQVTIRDLDKVTTILGAAIQAGANNINSVTFNLTDPSQLRSQAKEKAVENARANAEELAELNGVAVGRVISVSEVVDSGAYYLSEQTYSAAEGLGGGGGGPISPGEVTVSVQLQVVYEILE